MSLLNLLLTLTICVSTFAFIATAMKDIKSELRGILREQKSLESSTEDSFQGIKQRLTEIQGICHRLYDIIKDNNEVINKETSYPLTKEEIEKIIVTILNESNSQMGKEFNVLKTQGKDMINQLSQVAVSYQTTDGKLDGIYRLFIGQNELLKQFQFQPPKPSEEDTAFREENKNLKKQLEFYQSECQLFQQEIERLKASIQETEEKKKVSQSFNPYIITNNQEKYLITSEHKKDIAAKMGNTTILEKFFEDIPASNSYKKMYERYKKSLKKCLENAEEDDEIEEILSSVVNVVQTDLLKKIIVAVYRGKKSADSELEDRVLKAVNDYLESIVFYTRDTVCVGNILENKDFEDMEFIKDDQTVGKEHGEITEIELYPYYINYIDEEGEKRSIHTQGMMIVINGIERRRTDGRLFCGN